MSDTDDQIYEEKKQKNMFRTIIICSVIAALTTLSLVWMSNVRHRDNIITIESCKQICGDLGVQKFADEICECAPRPPPAWPKDMTFRCEPLQH